jgi:hypothetical protein
VKLRGIPKNIIEFIDDDELFVHALLQQSDRTFFRCPSSNFDEGDNIINPFSLAVLDDKMLKKRPSRLCAQ